MKRTIGLAVLMLTAVAAFAQPAAARDRNDYDRRPVVEHRVMRVERPIIVRRDVRDVHVREFRPETNRR